MIGYVTLGTDDLDRSRAFYDALFAELGAPLFKIDSEPSIRLGTERWRWRCSTC